MTTKDAASKKEEIVKAHVINSFLDADPTHGVDIVFSFDTTGSMQPVLDQVRGQVQKICSDLFKNIPKIRIAIITHGDFCDSDSYWCKEGMIQILNFTDDENKLITHVTTVGTTGGEGAHAGYEYVLHRANQLSWREDSAKALVLIGDVVPNPPSWTDQEFYWRKEMNGLYRKGVKIYGVQVYGFMFSLPFYQELSRRTGGCFLRLEQMHYISDMLRAITYREAGKLKKFAGPSKDPNYQYMVQALESKLSNVRVNDPREGWWDITLDKDYVRYVKQGDKYKRYSGPPLRPTRKAQKGKIDPMEAPLPPSPLDVPSRLTSLFSNPFAPIPAVAPAKQPAKTKISAKEHIANVIEETKDEGNEGYSQRTGGKIMDTSSYSKQQLATMAENRKKVMNAAMVDSGYTFVEVKAGVWEMVTKEEAKKRGQEGTAAVDESTVVQKQQTIERNKILQQANEQALALKAANTEKLTISKEEQKQFAVQRLMRDLREVKRTPLYGVSAMPLENNIMEWHANLTGPLGTEYNGVTFHLVIKFPSTYPRKPPKIRICSRLLHPNVYGNWVCLDMLEVGAFGSEAEADRINTGWSSGYSVVSILLQLQTFLFSDSLEDEDEDGAIFREDRHVKAAKRLADKFECDECGHNKADANGVKKIFPPFQENVPENSKGSSDPIDRTKPQKPAKKPAAKSTTKATEKVESEKKTEADKSPVVPTSSHSAVNLAALNRKKGEKALPLSFFKRDMPVEGIVESVREGLGAFVDIGADRNALLHVAAFTIEPVKSIAQEFPEIVPGARIQAFVTSVDLSEQKIGITLVKDPVIRAYRGQKTMNLSELKVGDRRYGKIARKQESAVHVNIDVYENDKKKLAIVPKSALKTPGCLVVWSAADFFESDYVALVITEINSRGQITANPAPAAPVTDPTSAMPQPVKTIEVHQTAGICNLDLTTLYEIMKYLNPITMGRLGATCKMMGKISDDGISYLWEKNEILCFHSRRHYTEDTLGIGVNLESKMNGKLAYITCTYDLVSHTAFINEEVRKASYKEKFTHWVPVFIDKNHGRRAMELAKIHMAKICADCYGSFEPWMVLEIMPKLMNTMVVSVMSGKLYGSIMALEGYCGFHHLLLNLMLEYPELQAKADEIIKNFINDPYKRHKKEVPALGEFLPLLTVTEAYKWEDVALPYLMEMFDRNVLWTLKKHKRLAVPSVTDEQKTARLRDTFSATVVSNHLLMFHVYFLKKIARPEGVSIAQISNILDMRYGRPTFAMKDQLLNEVKDIRKVKTWDGFFQKIMIPKPNDSTLIGMLHNALANSEQKRYHHPTDFIEAKPVYVRKEKSKDVDYHDDYYDRMERSRPAGKNNYY